MQWPDSTIFQGISEVARADPSRTAVVWQDETMSYGALLKESRALARTLPE